MPEPAAEAVDPGVDLGLCDELVRQMKAGFALTVELTSTEELERSFRRQPDLKAFEGKCRAAKNGYAAIELALKQVGRLPAFVHNRYLVSKQPPDRPYCDWYCTAKGCVGYKPDSHFARISQLELNM